METTAPPIPHTPPEQPSTPTPRSAVDDDGPLTKLHPNYVSALRLQAIFTALPIAIASLIVERELADNLELPFGIIAGPVLLIALIVIIRLPMRRYNARGYQISDDRLRVVRGLLWHSDTVVPFGRVQHIDVDQGPIERFFQIATLTLHTAGSHNASVNLPGLEEGLAREMREEIRAHIKRESL